MNGYYAIAIDGPSGAGKSTMARRLAASFGFLYVDTGAIYRTLGLACLEAGIDRKNEDAVMEFLPTLDIAIRYNGQGEQCMFLNGRDVSREIRLPEISLCASDVSAHQRVRSFLLDMQRKFARENNVIMDGRDRLNELKEKGSDQSFEEVLADMIRRDEQDTTRAAAPLKKADDAVELDSSDLNFEETFARLCEIVINTLTVSPEEAP